MRFKLKLSLLVVGSLAAVLAGMPARSQSLIHDPVRAPQQPSQQQIEGFCGNWGQYTEAEKDRLREQYERYCRDQPVFGRPAEPQEPQQQQQPQKPRKPEKPEKPRKPATPEKPDEPEPEIRPAKPEPVIPEPAPRRVDLVGELALAGPLAREPGERQRLRVTVENRGPDAPRGNRLWARVFLSERQVSRRGASSFSLPAVQQGRQVRLPGVPGPGRSREVTTEVTLPAGTPEGNYWWCVRLDTRQQVEETDEGNNTACVRKVVALGEDSDSELSGVFGSKLDGIQERDDLAQAPEQSREQMLSTLESMPENIQPTDDDGPIPSPVADDLEILRVTGLGPPTVTGDEYEGFKLGDAEFDKEEFAVFGHPYIYKLTVRNNGSEPARFRPYYTLGSDDTAHPGTFGFGSIGSGGEPGISIAGGEVKQVRMFVDLRREALDREDWLMLESRRTTVETRLFLGGVEADGDSFDERLYRDTLISNHVESISMNVVSTRLYRVVLRVPFFYVHDDGDPDDAAMLVSAGARFGDSAVERWIERTCRHARIIDGDTDWRDGALLVKDGHKLEVVYENSCGIEHSRYGDAPNTYPLVGYAPFNTPIVATSIWRELRGDRWFSVELKQRMYTAKPSGGTWIADDCEAHSPPSRYYFRPYGGAPVVSARVGGLKLVPAWHICIDLRVPGDGYVENIEPVNHVHRLGTAHPSR